MTYYYAIILPGNHVVTGWNKPNLHFPVQSPQDLDFINSLDVV